MIPLTWTRLLNISQAKVVRKITSGVFFLANQTLIRLLIQFYFLGNFQKAELLWSVTLQSGSVCALFE